MGFNFILPAVKPVCKDNTLRNGDNFCIDCLRGVCHQIKSQTTIVVFELNLKLWGTFQSTYTSWI